MKRSLVRSSLTGFLLALLSLGLNHASAEQMFSDEHYEIHYNAFNSTFVPADVAQRHGLTRSGVRGLLNVAVLKKLEDGSTQAVEANLTGEVSNLIQQKQPLTFKKIEEGDAIYYLGEFRFSNEERLNISLQVQPDPSRPAYRIQHEQTFYAD
ncbi:DUF4426 domain-containing protein [Nitrincola tapanii]|uniref:DUF4426 domain-containing protein n=1 Tax=Nitrincola tapanii TaxID=1708751 RepID=A0A5A9W1A9_9GAMM|nr:DUF4426 domain-containing protein [Nitrincola tapanii]KAA0874343.1 DUF4426 domain-containing protein [Nitrincola tapanii]